MSEIDDDAFRTAIEREDAGLPLPGFSPGFREPHEWPIAGDAPGVPATATADEGTSDHAITAEDRKTRGHVNTVKVRRWRLVRMPEQLALRLERLASEMHGAYVEGRVDLPGAMAEQVPMWFVVQAALDEVGARRARSARPRARKSV